MDKISNMPSKKKNKRSVKRKTAINEIDDNLLSSMPVNSSINIIYSSNENSSDNKATTNESNVDSSDKNTNNESVGNSDKSSSHGSSNQDRSGENSPENNPITIVENKMSPKVINVVDLEKEDKGKNPINIPEPEVKQNDNLNLSEQNFISHINSFDQGLMQVNEQLIDVNENNKAEELDETLYYEKENLSEIVNNEIAQGMGLNLPKQDVEEDMDIEPFELEQSNEDVSFEKEDLKEQVEEKSSDQIVSMLEEVLFEDINDMVDIKAESEDYSKKGIKKEGINYRNNLYKGIINTLPPQSSQSLIKLKLVDGMLDLDIKPGVALGAFYLGQTINSVISNLNYNSLIIPAVDFSHDSKDPLNNYFALSLSNNGIVLYFEPSSQTLVEISVQDMSRVRITYQGKVCSSEKVVLTSGLVHRILGPTYPGTFNNNKDQYILDYPGLSFHFNINNNTNELELIKEFDTNNNEIENNSIQSPICHKLSVYKIKDEQNYCYLSRVKVMPKVGIFILPLPNGLPNYGLWIKLNETLAQDIINDLGYPNKIYYKDDNRMSIHKSNNTKILSNNKFNSIIGDKNNNVSIKEPNDYFFNYFEKGIDILIDGINHKAKKIILHTNYPNQFNFNVYEKCHFEFLTNNEELPLLEIMINQFYYDLNNINSDTKYDSIIHNNWSPSIGNSVLLDRSFHDLKNPFLPTKLRGHESVLFEILDNDHLASVTLY